MKQGLLPDPMPARPGDIGSLLLSRAQAFFLKLMS